MVHGTAKLSIYVGGLFYIQVLTHATPILSVWAALEAIFLLLCWRWGYLETRAMKKKLRDTLVNCILLVFFAIALVEWTSGIQMTAMVAITDIDGILLLGIALNFVLQITAIKRRYIVVAACIFLALQFFPSIISTDIGLYTPPLPLEYLLLLSICTALLIILVVATAMFVRSINRPISTTGSQEVYMGSKYEIKGGNIGAVGDKSQANNFSQVWNENAGNISIAKLADEIEHLYTVLKPKAVEEAQDTSIEYLLAAGKSAKKGDGAATLEYMKKAGDWVWEAASKVGIGVATEAAKKALNL
jgi:hypothetical protein